MMKFAGRKSKRKLFSRRLDSSTYLRLSRVISLVRVLTLHFNCLSDDFRHSTWKSNRICLWSKREREMLNLLVRSMRDIHQTFDLFFFLFPCSMHFHLNESFRVTTRFAVVADLLNSSNDSMIIVDEVRCFPFLTEWVCSKWNWSS